MTRRARDNPVSLPAPTGEAHALTRVLVVPARRGLRSTVAARLKGRCDCIELSEGVTSPGRRYDVAVLDVDARCTKSVQAAMEELDRSFPGVPVVVTCPEADQAAVLAYVRLGAVDVVGPDEDLSERVRAAAQGAARRRAVELTLKKRLRRVREAYREAVQSRQELLRQMGSLCQDMAGSYRELSSKMKHVAMSSELTAVLRQELDLESLLRTTLEYILRKAGSCNAAVFLPGTSGDYSLGAYVNYDCAKDAAETLLDHLADVAAPAFADREGVVVMRNFSEICRELGRETDWLGDSTMAALSCRKDDECLAVMVFFRDRRTPFDEPVLASLRMIADAFGEQLSRVIRTHHRHLPHPPAGHDGLGCREDLDDPPRC